MVNLFISKYFLSIHLRFIILFATDQLYTNFLFYFNFIFFNFICFIYFLYFFLIDHYKCSIFIFSPIFLTFKSAINNSFYIEHNLSPIVNLDKRIVDLFRL